MSVTVGDISKFPIVVNSNQEKIKSLTISAERIQNNAVRRIEQSFDFVSPYLWSFGVEGLQKEKNHLSEITSQIDDEVYDLYNITHEDRAIIETELPSGSLAETEEDTEMPKVEEEIPQGITAEELAARWVSYAIGAVLGRFIVGSKERALGCAVYHIEDFVIGSLPVPREEEFNELVGAPETFAYIDEQGRRHVFSREVEKSLRALAFEDGISVLEEGHPRDLAARVEKALVLMLGENGAGEVVAAVTGNTQHESRNTPALRQFLEKEYFTKWHFKWYRKRPIYWAIQSAKRSYGFVIFHEKITRDTFYAIQRDPYLDTKRNAISLKMGDLQGAMSTATGSTRKRLEKELDGLQKVSAELEDFAKDLESITLSGYNPAPEWIDDGVILRMAPLWKVIPIWKAEPKKYWERLEAGDFDWSRIAMNYWADRVKAKCKTNKSYAIAHGHEEWYQGG
jgi:hypothetical protein